MREMSLKQCTQNQTPVAAQILKVARRIDWVSWIGIVATRKTRCEIGAAYNTKGESLTVSRREKQNQKECAKHPVGACKPAATRYDSQREWRTPGDTVTLSHR